MDRERFTAVSWSSSSTVCAVLTFGGLLTLLNLVGDNMNIFCVTYGIPLPYMQFDRFASMTSLIHALAQDDPVRQFWWPTLVYDLVFVVLLTGTFAFSVAQWSKAWTPLQHVIFCGISAAFVVPWLLPLTPSWSLLRLPALLMIPIAGFIGIIFGSWLFAAKKLGETGAWTGPVGMLAIIFIGGYVTFPRDLYHNPRRTDVPVLLKSLESDQPRLRERALNAIGGLVDTDPTLLDHVIISLDDPDRSVQGKAHQILSHLGPKAAAAVPKLIEHLDDKSDFLYSTTHTLERIGPAAREAIPALEERLRTSSDKDKLTLCNALLAIDPTNALIRPTLMELLPTSEGYETLGICRTLWQCDPNAALVVPALIKLLDNEYGPIRVDAAEMLGKIGPAAQAAIPKLMELINAAPLPTPTALPESNPRGVPTPVPMSEAEFDPRIRAAAQQALARIDLNGHPK